MDTDVKVYATISTSSVEYDKSQAEVPISELIERLEELRDDGVTHVVGTTGNYRGAQWVRLGEPEFDEDGF